MTKEPSSTVYRTTRAIVADNGAATLNFVEGAIVELVGDIPSAVRDAFVLHDGPRPTGLGTMEAKDFAPRAPRPEPRRQRDEIAYSDVLQKFGWTPTQFQTAKTILGFPNSAGQRQHMGRSGYPSRTEAIFQLTLVDQWARALAELARTIR